MIENMFSKHLNGQTIHLELYNDYLHKNALLQIAQHSELWTYQRPMHMPVKDYVEHYLDSLSKGHQNSDPLAYVVIDSHSNQALGSSRYYEISKTDKKCCIGFTWYTPKKWGTGINFEFKFLMLSQIFDTFDWNRVGFHVDARNMRSLAAMAKIGAFQEGILKQHKIVQGDFVRDTVQFAITRDDWPKIKNNLI